MKLDEFEKATEEQVEGNDETQEYYTPMTAYFGCHLLKFIKLNFCTFLIAENEGTDHRISRFLKT